MQTEMAHACSSSHFGGVSRRKIQPHDEPRRRWHQEQKLAIRSPDDSAREFPRATARATTATAAKVIIHPRGAIIGGGSQSRDT